MKKLLSILVFTLIFVGGIFAESKVKVTVKLSSSSKNMGYVTYSTSNTSGESYTSTEGSKSNSSKGGIFGIGAKSTSPYYIFARTSDSQKYYFVGWSKGEDNPNKIDTSIPRNGYQVGGSYAHSESKIVDETYYAHFKEIQTWNIVLAQVESGGSYEVKHTLNSVQQSYDVKSTGGNVNIPAFTDPASAELTLKAKAESNYRFYRWCIDYGEGNPIYNNTPNPTLTIAQSATISCEFISEDYAQFVVMGENNSYFKLSDAIAAANKVSASKVVVLKESGKLYLEAETTDYYDATAKKYTIPSDVTLLIPNSDNRNDYTVQMNELSVGEIEAPVEGESNPFKEVKCLTIDKEQDIEVYGDICVYAKVAPNTGAVRAYGRLHLGNNSNIVLKSGASLSVIGYITGEMTSSISAESGAIVREVIQIPDWRGGTMLSEIVKNKNYPVFPISQYYIQNIETNLILAEGAVEYVSSVANILSFSVPMNATLIAPKGGDYSGLFRLGAGAVLTKYYDKNNDRLKFDIKGASAKVYFDKIKLDLSNVSTDVYFAMMGALGTTEISSGDYILPITNNIDIHFYGGINVYVDESIALLAGSTLRADKEVVIETSGDAAIYVYDADEHHAQAMETKGVFTKDYYYNYFGESHAPIYTINRPEEGMLYDRTSEDLDEWTNSNVQENKTKLQKNDAKIILNGSLKGQIYTTNGGASIISDNSEANATVTFSNLKEQNIYQAIQYSNVDLVYGKIPCLPSAALQNGDKTTYSAGTADANGKTYTYYPLWDNGRWSDVLPDGVLTPMSLEGNGLTITLPEEKTASVTFTPQANQNYVKNINSVVVEKTTFSGTRFASNGDVTFIDGVVTIPVKYTPTTTHDDNITAPEIVTVYFNCTNISGQSEVVPLAIPLTATQNYQPRFLINEKEDEEITLTFPTTVVGQTSAEQRIVVTPVEENVTDRTYNDGKGFVTWTLETLTENSPFEITGDYFTGAEVVYKPTTTAGTHTQTLTLKATYSDGVETTKYIVLTGTPQIKQNPLQFVGESVEIYPGDEINSVFGDMGNGTDITFTFTTDGLESTNNDIIELISSNGNYKLQVKSGVNIIEQQTITIKATQSANEVTSEGADVIVVTVIPSVQWNWSKLYFGNTYYNPIVVQNADDPWTLTYNNDCAAISASKFTGDATNGYQVEVGSGNEGVATFTFTQKGYSLTLSATVYADPRILDMCVSGQNAARTFEDISVEKTNVKYDNGILFATTEGSGAAWTMEIVGVPNEMQFIPHGEGKKWTIVESDGVNETTTRSEAEIVLAEGQTHFVHKLKASTKKIRIICSLGAEQGKITDLCVYRLDGSVSADVEKLYLPITRDNQNQVTQSEKIVRLSYVSPESDLWLSVVDDKNNTVDDITLFGNFSDGKLPKTTIDNIYREEAITVSRTSSYSTEGIVYLLVKDKDNQQKLKLPIRLYNYPQPLPMRSAEWKDANAEKYYFYTDFSRSQNVQFNAGTQKLTFASSGSAQRFVTFAFRGGPSYISFNSLLDFVPQDNVTPEELVLQEWYEYWSLQVTDGESPRLVANNAEAEVQPEIEAEVRDGKTYYSIRIAIPYTTKSLTLQSKRALAVEVENIVIDGEPDLDVVLGNHTIEHEGVVNFTPKELVQNVEVTAINLEQLNIACNNEHFTVKYGDIVITSTPTTPTTLTATECPNALGNYMVGNIALNVVWDGENVVEEGVLIFTDKNDQELASIRLLGTKDYILKDNSENTGLFTGFAENITAHPFINEDSKYQYARREVDLSNTFDVNGVALFDYLIVYGETTADDLGNTINAPTTAKGSNANTPIYIYRKMQNEDGVYDRYQFVFEKANVNEGEKVALHKAKDVVLDGEQQTEVQLIPHAKETAGTEYIDIAADEQLRVYMTGFCPYASTGFKKNHEGVWLFRGKKNAKLDVYLEDCHIYSRNKTEDGHSYNGKNDSGADIFQDDYACGSGGVLVFECNQEGEYLDSEAFQVSIHTRGRNLLKSNYGCFYEILGVRAYQVSSPVQVRLTSNIFYEQNSKTHLTFDDKWLTDATDVTKFTRTNGFISLQKQANNAPSIDMGNGNTVVNFRGGQVELQNAQNVSDKYKTTLAISYRSGIMAAGGVEIQMAYGIGTDAATKGTVNFYDGTISVIPMYVDAADRKYYLMDVDDPTTPTNEAEYTSCLRCPQHTYVYGGSICMLRACMSPTSQGGAPTDGVSLLGRFFYTEAYGYEYNTSDKKKPANQDDATQWLVNPVKFPTDITLFEGLADYHQNDGKYTYGIESVTPDENGQLIFWIPDGFGGVEAEHDRYLTTWKACMPEITAVLAEVGVTKIGGTVGGKTSVANIEDVNNLLYCQLDDNIYDVISATEGEDENERYVYEAPLKVPDGFNMEGVDLGLGDYMRLAPSAVGAIDEHEMENTEDYNINSKVYYVSSATADNWMTFTAPFDVENIWVVETYDEVALSNITVDEDEDGITKRGKILEVQATHNADFASFFAVAMALGSEKDFDGIFGEYMGWARLEDKHQGDIEDYTKRGMYSLKPYYGTNWSDANFYLYHNNGNWTIKDATNGEFETKWEYVQKEGDVLLEKGETYSMLFPYCVGCDEELDAREYWDYWSGKLIIFESTQASKEHPHVIRGSNFVAPARPEKGEWVFQQEDIAVNASEVVVTGNSTFANMTTSRSDVFIYSSDENEETFKPAKAEQTILPTTAFLYGYVPKNLQGMPALRISREGKIDYGVGSDDNGGTTTGGEHVPTINGGSDLFVTSRAEGINIAVSEPQAVGVFSATGALLYSGWVETSVDVNLVVNGVYVVVGENESVKIIY